MAQQTSTEHHHVTPTMDGDRVAWDFTCTAPPEAFCRSEWGCACEQITDLQRTPDGTAWQHRDPWADGDDSPAAVHVQTGTTDPGACNIVNWLSEDGSMAEELYTGRDGVHVHAGPIATTWEGDYYSWQYADESHLAASPAGHEDEAAVERDSDGWADVDEVEYGLRQHAWSAEAAGDGALASTLRQFADNLRAAGNPRATARGPRTPDPRDPA